MAAKTWVLTDVSEGTFVEHLDVTSNDVPGSPAGWSVTKRTLRGGLSDGVEVVEINNGKLSFGILLTRGMSLSTAVIGKQSFGWKSPVQGPVHPKYVPLNEPSGLGWLDGFDEMMVRCGLPILLGACADHMRFPAIGSTSLIRPRARWRF